MLGLRKPTPQQLSGILAVISLLIAVALWQQSIWTIFSFLLLFSAFTGGYVQAWTTYGYSYDVAIIKEGKKNAKPNAKTKTNKKV